MLQALAPLQQLVGQWWLLALCSTLGLLLLYTLTHLGSRRSTLLRRIPGPPGLPLLGNTLQLVSRTRHRSILLWAEQYGGVFKASLWGRPYVIVSESSAASQVLSQPKCLEWYRPKAAVLHARSLHNIESGPADECWRVIRWGRRVYRASRAISRVWHAGRAISAVWRASRAISEV